MSKIEVDAIDKQSGSTLTLGGSGTAVTLACGATQTGFGRTGTVNWQTGSIKTATFTAANGEGYFCNTAGGTFEVDLPAGSAGAIVSIQDYNNTFDSNALTVDPNGSEKINGGTAGESVILQTEGQGVTFIYIDATVGWRSVQDNTFSQSGQPPFVAATGGTITTSGNCKIHTFTGPGTFTVTNLSPCSAQNEISYLVVAGGGGGGGQSRGGGGGAGGFRETKSPVTPYTASPLDGQPSAPNRITVTETAFPITVGAGGTKGTNSANGGVGANSVFSTITSAGGGYGTGAAASGTPGGNGGSGGGGNGEGSTSPGGTGNSPPTSPAQGTNGGAGRVVPGCRGGGGGGGATVAGQQGQPPYAGGDGGAGATTSINASPTAFAGGGGGGGNGNSPFRGGTGGTGGGGAGGGRPSPGGNLGVAGTDNTGGGGGGAANPTCNPSGFGSAGGSGIVIIRYKFQ